MVPVISVRVADVPAVAVAAGAAAAGAEEEAGVGAAAEEGVVEADVTLPSGRPQEGLQLYLAWIYSLGHALRNNNYYDLL